jgi:hypothetical protein
MEEPLRISRETARKLVLGAKRMLRRKKIYCILRYYTYSNKSDTERAVYAVCFSERGYQSILRHPQNSRVDRVFWGSGAFHNNRRRDRRWKNNYRSMEEGMMHYLGTGDRPEASLRDFGLV